MYPRCDIDKARGRGETWPVDPELRDALNQVAADLRDEIRSGDTETREALDRLGADLRGEIRSGDAETREALNQLAVNLRGEIQTSAASFLHQIQGQIRESEERMRRHFDVVAESLRADNRSVAEGTVLFSQRTDRRFDEETGRTDRLEGRVLRLEVRVSSLEGDRKPRRPRRRR
jgi:hypothetical protein